ncbi:MAG: hypothetical protein D6685_13940, partial [Bacteroidetes bacterium]
MHIDDPVVVGRYLAMLDQVLPIALAHGTFAFGAGHEVNEYLSDHPDEASHFVNFLRAVRDHVRTVDQRLPVGVILTKDAVLDESDLAGYNYYPRARLGHGFAAGAIWDGERAHPSVEYRRGPHVVSVLWVA